MKFRYLPSLIAPLFALSFPVQAEKVESVLCHLSYGGESIQHKTQAVSSPYPIAPIAIGSFFLFRVVWQTEPADIASIKIYTYANQDNGARLIHQATFPYPVHHSAVNGFSGQQSVYEPIRDGEIQYWCELKTETNAK